MEVIWSDFEVHDLDAKLIVFEKPMRPAMKQDLSQPLDLPSSEKNGFWEREL